MKSFQEKLYQHHAQIFTVETVLHQSRTEFQDVLVFENPIFGRVLVLDGIIQLTERDNHIYHEMIAHVPLMAHGQAQRVLIIGGGDGGTLKEVLKHPVHQAVLVELDKDVIALSRRFFPGVSDGAFDDPRAEVIVRDGARYVAETGQTFDVIIIDSTDPIGPGEQLFSESFYRDCRKLLRPRGIVALQSGAPFFQPGELQAVCARLEATFGAARPFLAPVPTYAAGMLALVAAGESLAALRPPMKTLRQRFKALRGKTRYYSPEVHRAAFTLAPSFAPLPGSRTP
ncbi:MAG: polyamine aminopropyltransferase [Variibacter sp.]|nr:polyamine aminopropyltransferase [Variibacter sp.]